MKQKQFETYTAEDTQRLGQKLALLLRPNDVITLSGDLGAGKTTFTKGIGTGLGVMRMINSPTFTIVKTYHGELPLYHIDAYRLEDSEEDIGFDEYFNGDGISVVEWPQFIESFLPDERLDFIFERKAGDKRLILCEPKGEFFEYVCEELAR
ncbi:tRNA (adenosine(37)-N6)-threonylcarbamoyltransferase complex ATPase subunit type 1 TsaE [Amphibacillus sediminis]|uniref:tRNA (adenosine(37)-N6)-threonylcarbamoyltransferase complex ATPase subunit type 1 TsaE n=1 Tax=Amphibacillus sediminis TaxID=360185 RepID=UPI0008364DBD|nr:tRNA (adenosine(37)-N6)-threonylcarbamoyltransferase complex ATPase subunit type 1 TsaE [Amphibacillus sediminis]